MRQFKITQKITARTPVLERYLREVEQEPMITQAEEIELARLIKNGDLKAEEKLIRANLRFVISVAKKYSGQSISLEDVINDGNIGLIKSAKKFDETRGFKFISYAVWWIRQSIMEQMPNYKRSIRMPLNVEAMLLKIKKWSIEFEQKNGREPSQMEICDEFDNLEGSDFMKMQSHSIGEYSLDSKLEVDGESTFADFLPSDTIDVFESIEKENRSNKICRILDSCLSHMESDIIRMTYGIGIPNRPDGMSNDEIGKHFFLTSERIRQIRERALKKLKSVAKTRRIFND